MALLRQLMIFGVVGTLGFLVDVAVLYALSPWVGWYAGRALSFWAAATTTWWFNRRYTFRAVAAADAVSSPSPRLSPQPASARADTVRQYLRYLVSMLGGGALNYLVYAATLHFAPGPYAAVLGVALGSIAGLAVNFLTARFLVFRQRAEPAR